MLFRCSLNSSLARKGITIFEGCAATSRRGYNARPADGECLVIRRSALILILGIGAALGGCSQSSEERISSIYELRRGEISAQDEETIRGFLEDPEGDVRATALFSLAAIPVADAVELALEGLQDPEFFVRMTAAKLLGDLGDPVAVPALADRLRFDEDWHVRQRAAEALGRLGGATASEALAEGLDDPLKEVRLASVEGLAANDPSVATTTLRRMVRSDSEWEVRVRAARALGSIGTEEVRGDLEAALEDDNEFVRSAAAYAIRLLDPDEGEAVAP